MKKIITSFAISVCFSLLFGQNITLKGSLTTGNSGTDVWEYIDQTTGNIYAIVGGNGMSVVDVTNPLNISQVAHLNSVPGFDVKVWSHYVYCSTSGGGTGRVVDVSDPTNPEIVGSFPSGHNIYIDERGYMYNSSPGVRIYDLNPDPTNPTFLTQVGNSGHDVTVRGDLMIDCHGGSGTNLYNVCDPANPVLLGSITDPTISYHHQGDISKDGNYLYICDELGSHPQADISIWDISDPSDANRVGEVADPNSTPHNLYVIDDYAYVSHYTAGFRVFDVSNPAVLALADEYDTSNSSGEGFAGAFGVYPSPATGNIYINDGSGVYVFGFSELEGGTPFNNATIRPFVIAELFGGPMGAVQMAGPFDNTTATTDEADPTTGFECFGEPNGSASAPTLENTLWFSFVGDGNNYDIETSDCGGGLANYIDDGDTQMAIYQNDCGTLIPIECNEDSPNATATDFFSGVTDFDTVDGMQYLIMVDGFNLKGAISEGEYCINITNNSFIGIEDLSSTEFGLVSLSPNPASDEIRIELNNDMMRDLKISVVSINGQQVYSQLTSSNAGSDIIVLDVNHYAAGMYILQISDHQSVTTSKFIVN